MSGFVKRLRFRWSLRDMFRNTDRLQRLLTWDFCDPLKWWGTDLYCREHDGPPPGLRQRIARRVRRFLYLRIGWKRMLISGERRSEIERLHASVERRYREGARPADFDDKGNTEEQENGEPCISRESTRPAKS